MVRMLSLPVICGPAWQACAKLFDLAPRNHTLAPKLAQSLGERV